jgi:hypothetical protein
MGDARVPNNREYRKRSTELAGELYQFSTSQIFHSKQEHHRKRGFDTRSVKSYHHYTMGVFDISKDSDLSTIYELLSRA